MGYKSILESRPQVTVAFLSLWQKGYSLRKSREELLTQFPAEDVPSINALNNYLKNHLQDTEEGRLAYHKTLARKYDCVTKAYTIALESQKRYQFAVAGRAGLSTVNKSLKQWGDANTALFKLEMEMGLRSPVKAEPEVSTSNTVGEFKMAATAEEHRYRINNDRAYNKAYLAKNAAEQEVIANMSPDEHRKYVEDLLESIANLS